MFKFVCSGHGSAESDIWCIKFYIIFLDETDSWRTRSRCWTFNTACNMPYLWIAMILFQYMSCIWFFYVSDLLCLSAYEATSDSQNIYTKNQPRFTSIYQCTTCQPCGFINRTSVGNWQAYCNAAPSTGADQMQRARSPTSDAQQFASRPHRTAFCMTSIPAASMPIA